ncbi:hypothetical protein ACHAXS_002311 [Conticribra weissflogii]
MTPIATASFHFVNENLPKKFFCNQLSGIIPTQSDSSRNHVYKRRALQKHNIEMNKKRRRGQVTDSVDCISSKRVSFSDKSRMHIYRNKSPKMDLTYSKLERKQFAKDAIMTARRIDAVMAANKNNDFKRPVLDGMEEIIGIEQFIDGAKLARSNSEQRKKHRHAILLEQKRQKVAGMHDPLKIASISFHYSEEAVRRANIRASYVLYLK